MKRVDENVRKKGLTERYTVISVKQSRDHHTYFFGDDMKHDPSDDQSLFVPVEIQSPELWRSERSMKFATNAPIGSISLSAGLV